MFGRQPLSLAGIVVHLSAGDEDVRLGTLAGIVKGKDLDSVGLVRKQVGDGVGASRRQQLNLEKLLRAGLVVEQPDATVR